MISSKDLEIEKIIGVINNYTKALEMLSKSVDELKKLGIETTIEFNIVKKNV